MSGVVDETSRANRGSSNTNRFRLSVSGFYGTFQAHSLCQKSVICLCYNLGSVQASVQLTKFHISECERSILQRNNYHRIKKCRRKIGFPDVGVRKCCWLHANIPKELLVHL